jgi:hypothetical protein
MINLNPSLLGLFFVWDKETDKQEQNESSNACPASLTAFQANNVYAIFWTGIYGSLTHQN